MLSTLAAAPFSAPGVVRVLKTHPSERPARGPAVVRIFKTPAGTKQQHQEPGPSSALLPAAVPASLQLGASSSTIAPTRGDGTPRALCSLDFRQEGCWPGAYLLGAQKCGTTSFFVALQKYGLACGAIYNRSSAPRSGGLFRPPGEEFKRPILRRENKEVHLLDSDAEEWQDVYYDPGRRVR